METLALFADATASRIVYGFLDPEETPIRLIPIGISDQQVRHAAENGCFAAFQVLRGLGYIDEGQKYCLSYQFAEDEERLHVLGGSAGLAFCLKFAQEIARQITDDDFGFSIAATGVISNGTAQAEVGRIEGLQAKLQAAIASLQPGGRLFYPSQNTELIEPSVRSAAAEKGIDLIPVATVLEAISSLLAGLPAQKRLRSPTEGPEAAVLDSREQQSQQPQAPQRKMRWVVMLSLIALLALLIPFLVIDPCHPISQWRLRVGDGFMCTLSVFLPPEPDTIAQRIVDDLEWGRYRQAQRRLQRTLKCATEPDDRLLDLHRQMTQDLSLTLAFHHTAKSAVTPSGSQDPSTLPTAVLNSGDGFQFDITPTGVAFLYVYHVDAKGAPVPLFPNTQSSPVRNPLAIEQRLRLPAGDQWFILDQNPGQETIYFVATPWPSRDLDAMFLSEPSSVQPDRQTQILDPLIHRLQVREHARACGMRGVFYQQYDFQHRSPKLLSPSKS